MTPPPSKKADVGIAVDGKPRLSVCTRLCLRTPSSLGAACRLKQVESTAAPCMVMTSQQ